MTTGRRRGSEGERRRGWGTGRKEGNDLKCTILRYLSNAKNSNYDKERRTGDKNTSYNTEECCHSQEEEELEIVSAPLKMIYKFLWNRPSIVYSTTNLLYHLQQHLNKRTNKSKRPFDQVLRRARNSFRPGMIFILRWPAVQVNKFSCVITRGDRWIGCLLFSAPPAVASVQFLMVISMLQPTLLNLQITRVLLPLAALVHLEVIMSYRM